MVVKTETEHRHPSPAIKSTADDVGIEASASGPAFTFEIDPISHVILCPVPALMSRGGDPVKARNGDEAD